MYGSPQSVWKTVSGDLVERLSSDLLALGGESTPLIVVPAKASSTKLLFQHSVLFDQVLHHLLLMTVDPNSERDQEQLGGVQDGSHPGILAVIKQRSGSHLRPGWVLSTWPWSRRDLARSRVGREGVSGHTSPVARRERTDLAASGGWLS